MVMIDERVIDDKLSALIATLIDKTREGKVSWNHTVNDDEFLAGFSRYVVSVRRDIVHYEDEGGSESLIEIALLNENGQVMEVKTSYASGSSILNPNLTDDFENLRELFTLARRSAHNVEEGLTDILQELESR